RGSAKYENAHLLSIQRSLAELPKTWVFLGRLAEPNPTQHFLSLNPTQPKNLVGLGWVTRLGPHAGPGPEVHRSRDPGLLRAPSFRRCLRFYARKYECTLLRAYIRVYAATRVYMNVRCYAVRITIGGKKLGKPD